MPMYLKESPHLVREGLTFFSIQNVILTIVGAIAPPTFVILLSKQPLAPPTFLSDL